MSAIYCEHHFDQLLDLLLQNIIIEGCFFAEKRDQDGSLKILQAIWQSLEVREEVGVEVKDVHCELGIPTIGQLNRCPFEYQV
jgi:hypothetical protein